MRNYAFALLFITPLALLMVQLAHPQPVGPTLEARVVETAIGVVVGQALGEVHPVAAAEPGLLRGGGEGGSQEHLDTVAGLL